MTGAPGGHASVNVTHHLEGTHFPASKDDLLLRARDNGAGQDTLEVLEAFPDDRNSKALTM